MIVRLLTEHHLEFLSLKGGCRGSSESTHVKMPHCWKSHALAILILAICHLIRRLINKAVVQWISAMPCKPGVTGSIPGFSRNTFG